MKIIKGAFIVLGLVAVTSPAPAADNEPPSYLETLANCRRIIVAGIDAPHCAKLIAARDAEPRPYTGDVDLTIPTYSTDSKEYIAQRRAASAEHIARLRTESAERIAGERNMTTERIAGERNATTRGVARINAERATQSRSMTQRRR